MCYPWSNRNATSVLQRRKPGQMEKHTQKKQKQNSPITWKATFNVRSNLLCQENVFFLPLPPPKKNKQKKTNKEHNTKPNIRVKN